jgi:PqqD family protein of HPr-rel-A system
MSAEFVWELVDAALLSDRQWGTDTLLWHQASGDTHLLDDLATQIYRRLQQSPASQADLAAALPTAVAQPSSAPDGRSRLEATLQEMARLGLVLVRPL